MVDPTGPRPPDPPPASEGADRGHPIGAPRVTVAIEEAVAAGAMGLLVLITLANVLARYLTDESFAWTEEISIFLIVVLTLAGAAAAAARDRHIRIEYFYDAGGARRRRRLGLLAAWTTAAFFAALAVLLGRVAFDEWSYGETSMAIGIPRWWYTVWLPVLCAAVALRAAGWARRRARIAAGPDAIATPTGSGREGL